DDAARVVERGRLGDPAGPGLGREAAGGQIGEHPGDAVLVHAADHDAAAVAAGRGGRIEADHDAVKWTVSGTVTFGTIVPPVLAPRVKVTVPPVTVPYLLQHLPRPQRPFMLLDQQPFELLLA